MSLPPYIEDTQITTEQIANNVKIFYNITTYNLPLPIDTANNRVRNINTQENGQVILKIGDTNITETHLRSCICVQYRKV